MTRIVHEFMHVHAVEHGCSAFLDADKIDAKHEQQASEDRPGQNFADGIATGWIPGCVSVVIAENSLDFASNTELLSRKRGRTLARFTERSQWRDRAGFEPVSAAHDSTVNDRRRKQTCQERNRSGSADLCSGAGANPARTNSVCFLSKMILP